MIAWTDIESSGLDEREHLLLEVALVITDDDLHERAAASWVIDPGMKSADIPMQSMFVREMHEKSGLLRDIDNGTGLPLSDAIKGIRSWLTDTFGRLEDLRQIPIAGSTVGFDRRFIRHNMPEVEGLFSYRSIDISALTELASRWARRIYGHRPKQDKQVPHRALDDVRNSIEYLKYYRAAGLIDVEDDVRIRAQRHVTFFNNNCPFEGCDVCRVRAFDSTVQP